MLCKEILKFSGFKRRILLLTIDILSFLSAVMLDNNLKSLAALSYTDAHYSLFCSSQSDIKTLQI